MFRGLWQAKWWLARLSQDHIRLLAVTLISTIAALVTRTGWFYDGDQDLLINMNTSWIVFSASYLLLTGVVIALATPESTAR